MFGEVLLEKFRRKKREDKIRQFLSVKFVDLLTESKREKYLKYLKGDIIISHCKGHDTIILLLTLNILIHIVTFVEYNFFCRLKNY